MPTSETRIKPNHIALNGAPALTAAYVPTNAGTIEVSNRIAWEARIHSTIAIGEPRAEGPKRVPSAGLVAVVSFSRTHDARCSVFWIPLSGFALFPPRGEGVSPEAVLLHAEADSRAPVVDLGARARDPQRPHPGRDRRGDAFGSHDRHEVAHPNGVEVLAPGLDPTPMRVAEIPDIFPGFVNLTAAVSLVRRGCLDFTKLHGIGSGAMAPILWGDTLRRLGRVFGRTEEFRILDAWASSSSSVLVASGIAGIGKSTLVASWLVRQRPRPYIYWSEIHEGTTRTLLLRDLAAFLARLGRRGLRSVLAENRSDAWTIGRRILSLEIRDLSILFVLDNVQHANPELAKFLSGPLLEVAEAGSAKAVFISRTIPAALSRGNPEKRPRVQILRVGGLDEEASKSLLLSKGFAGDEVAVGRAVQAAKGHPILLSFAAHTGSAVGGEMTRYLDREIWHTLTKTERTLLEAASLFRGLVPLDALLRFSSESPSAIQTLQSKNLIAPTMSSGVVMHDAIREYVRKRIPDSRRRAYHALAATYFLDGSGMRDRLEGLFHLVESGDAAAVGDVLVSTGATLLDSVPATDLQEVLKRIDVEAISSSAASVLPELRGDALRAIGHLQPALQEYRNALSLAEEHRQAERSPSLLRKIASIERCRADYPKALGHLVDAQAGLKDHPNPAEGG